jgi:alkylation response protein AidB-like acyl-CoA dehydrogenase
VIFTEGMRLEATVNGMGINMVGPMLMHYGTEEQRRVSGNILSADESGVRVFPSGLGRPGVLSAGRCKTGRVRHRGAKIWTSNAHAPGAWLAH